MYYMENPQEIWKDIPGFEGYYQASTLGRIKSLPRIIKRLGKGDFPVFEKILKLCMTPKGYQFVHLHKGTSKKTWRIHTLIAMTFLNHNPDGTMKIIVDHINSIKTDNKVCNLQLTTNRHNCSKDKKNKSSKYTGVMWFKRDSKWRAQITTGFVNKHLGYFDCEEDARDAYENAVKLSVQNNIKK